MSYAYAAAMPTGLMVVYSGVEHFLKVNFLLMHPLAQGYRDRYDIIDHGHEKKTFMYIFHRSIFTEIRELATSVLWKFVVHFGYRGRNCTGVDIIS